MIDVTYGNIAPEKAEQLAEAVFKAGGMVHPEYEAGATESWIAHLVAGLIIARGAETVLETGAFHGHTTVVLERTLEALGGGSLIACEIDPVRAAAVEARLDDDPDNPVQWTVRNEDALTVIRSLPDLWLDIAFVDDDHTPSHVADEIDALWSKMSPNGLILFHDAVGVCQLAPVIERAGGLVLDLPRCGPAGGLGIIQCK